MEPVKSFKDLKVWQSAYRLSLEVYKICAHFPDHEKFALSSQMTRAAVSVCSNIAEGFGRKTAKDKEQFYTMANGSLTELENQLLIACGVGYMSKDELKTIAKICSETHKMLYGLRRVNNNK